MVKGGREDGSYIWEDPCGDRAAKEPKQPLPFLFHPVCYIPRQRQCMLSPSAQEKGGWGLGWGEGLTQVTSPYTA